MCKKNKAGGCNCCCKPITERDDDFPSLWQCYKGKLKYIIGDPDGFEALKYWYVDGSTDQLVYSKHETTAAEPFPICIDAVRLALPFTMEMEVEVAELNTVSSSTANLLGLMYERAMFSGSLRDIGGQFNIGSSGSGWYGNINYPPTLSPTSSQTIQFAAVTPPFTIKHEILFETDGLSQWVYINGSLATVTSGSAWGTKLTGSISSFSFSNDDHRTWRLQLPTTAGIRTDWAKFDRWHVREWQ